MLGCRSKLQGYVLTWNLVEQSEIDDGFLHFVQRDEAAKRKSLLFGLNDHLVARERIRGEILQDFFLDDMRFRIVVTAAAVARNVACECAQQPRRLLRGADKKPCLRQLKKAQKGFLHAVEGVIGPHAFTHHQARQAGAVRMYQLRHPAKETLLLLRCCVPVWDGGRHHRVSAEDRRSSLIAVDIDPCLHSLRDEIVCLSRQLKHQFC